MKTKNDVGDLLQRRFERNRADAEDRRCMRGKYAPPKGVCRVCGGVVAGVVEFEYTGMIGGPPVPAHVEHWACRDCGLLYGKCPPPADETSGKVLP